MARKYPGRETAYPLARFLGRRRTFADHVGKENDGLSGLIAVLCQEGMGEPVKVEGGQEEGEIERGPTRGSNFDPPGQEGTPWPQRLEMKGMGRPAAVLPLEATGDPAMR